MRRCSWRVSIAVLSGCFHYDSAQLLTLLKHQKKTWEQKSFLFKTDATLQATSHVQRKTSQFYPWDPCPHSCSCFQTDSVFSWVCWNHTEQSLASYRRLIDKKKKFWAKLIFSFSWHICAYCDMSLCFCLAWQIA